MLLKVIKLLAVSIGITIILVLLIGALLSQASVEALLLLPLLVGLALLAVITIAASGVGRGRRAWMILASLQQAVSNNLPLPRIVRAIGMAERGQLGRQMQQVYEALETGAPVAVVLSTIPQMPERVIRMVVAAERVGRLPQALDRIVQQRRAALAESRGRFPFYRIYPLLLIVVYIAISSMLMIFVMPKFEQIFKDFGVSLPKTTLTFLRASHDLGPLLMVFAGMLFFLLIVSSVASWWPGAASGLVEGLGGWVLNRLPVIGRMRMYHSLAEVLDFAADGVEAGRPLGTALAEASLVSPNSKLREQLDTWNSEMSDGALPADAARAAGMPALLCGMISSAARTTDLGAVFRFLARYYAQRFSRTSALLEAAILPTLALVMGTLVGWLVLAMFLPMTRLIMQSCPYPITP
jgi:type IV pilus assembly protein PilC